MTHPDAVLRLVHCGSCDQDVQLVYADPENRQKGLKMPSHRRPNSRKACDNPLGSEKFKLSNKK